MRKASEILAFNIRKKDQIRELRQAGITVHEAVAVVCYLENLSHEFDTFCTVNMMKEDLKLGAVMQGAVDFAQASIYNDGEAADYAMYAGDGQRRRHGKHPAGEYTCDNCGYYGRCGVAPAIGRSSVCVRKISGSVEMWGVTCSSLLQSQIF